MTVCGLTRSGIVQVSPIPVCTIKAVPVNTIYTGGVPTTIYLEYGPQQIQLNATPKETGGIYTYLWKGEGLSNLNTAQPVFTATKPGVYTLQVQVTNEFGCASSCTIVITVIDVRVLGTTNKVDLCHNGERLSVSVNSVEAHPGRHGTDRLGDCNILPVTSGPVMQLPVIGMYPYWQILLPLILR